MGRKREGPVPPVSLEAGALFLLYAGDVILMARKGWVGLLKAVSRWSAEQAVVVGIQLLV